MKVFFLIFFFTLIVSLKSLDFCDDCFYSCCRSGHSCAMDESHCNCDSSLCRNGCCVNNKCGSSSDCSGGGNLLAITVGAISSFCLAACCVLACLHIFRAKKKIGAENSVVGIMEMEQSPISSGNHMAIISYDLVSEVHSTVTFVTKPPIACVVIGKPVEFPPEQTFLKTVIINSPNSPEINRNAKLDEG